MSGGLLQNILWVTNCARELVDMEEDEDKRCESSMMPGDRVKPPPGWRRRVQGSGEEAG